MFYIYNEFFPPVIIISYVQPEREYLKFVNCHIWLMTLRPKWYDSSQSSLEE